MNSRYKGLISIAGVIGVGKTTLADNLAASLGGSVVYEQYKENPFLARQFSGCCESALPSELFFLLSRAQQLAVENYHHDSLYITDYIFQKNRFFAGMSLDSRQLDIYDEVEKAVSLVINKPEIVIYLYDSIENCHERILRRGRAFEKSISLDFLTKLHDKYENLFDSWSSCPVIKVDCGEIDLRENDALEQLSVDIRTSLQLS